MAPEKKKYVKPCISIIHVHHEFDIVVSSFTVSPDPDNIVIEKEEETEEVNVEW